MRVVLQRVSRATVHVAAPDGPREAAAIGRGLVALVGVRAGDDRQAATRLANRVAGLRVFDDTAGKLNLSLLDVAAEVLVVSNFTLYGDCEHGRRPSFTQAAPAAEAKAMVDCFAEALGARGVQCRCGVFGARMTLELVNDGPVTLILEEQVR